MPVGADPSGTPSMLHAEAPAAGEIALRVPEKLRAFSPHNAGSQISALFPTTGALTLSWHTALLFFSFADLAGLVRLLPDFGEVLSWYPLQTGGRFICGSRG